MLRAVNGTERESPGDAGADFVLADNLEHGF
jgi:hypothetical protein